MPPSASPRRSSSCSAACCRVFPPASNSAASRSISSEIATPGNSGFYTSFQSVSQQVAIFVAAILGFVLSEMMPADDGRGMGLAHSVLHRLPDHSVHLLAAADAGGDAGIPGHEEASDHDRKCSARRRPTGASSARHDDGGDDHRHLLLRHRLYADLRQEAMPP